MDTNLIELVEDDSFNNFPNQPGIIRIHLCFLETLDKLEYFPIKSNIKRIGKNDIEGILFIGYSEKAIADEAMTIKKSLIPKYSSNHPFGKNYLNFIENFPRYEGATLYSTFEESDNPKELRDELLKKYENEFGELPPFNKRM